MAKRVEFKFIFVWCVFQQAFKRSTSFSLSDCFSFGLAWPPISLLSLHLWSRIQSFLHVFSIMILTLHVLLLGIGVQVMSACTARAEQGFGCCYLVNWEGTKVVLKAATPPGWQAKELVKAAKTTEHLNDGIYYTFYFIGGFWGIVFKM